MTNQFVPAEEIHKLSEGSFEHLADRLDETVARNMAMVFGAKKPNQIQRIATFENKVVLATDDGRFTSVVFEEAQNGQLHIVSVTPAQVPTYDESNLYSYLVQEASNVIDRWMNGDHKGSTEILDSLIPHIMEQTDPTDSEKVDAVAATIRRATPWKRLYQAQSETIKSFLGAAILEDIEAHHSNDKYAKLNESAVSSSEGFRDVVTSDLEFLASICEGMSENLVNVDLNSLGAKVEGDEAALLQTFGAFAEDLKISLNGAAFSIRESLKSIESVSALGKLHDSLAEEVKHFEVASCFVHALQNSLTN